MAKRITLFILTNILIIGTISIIFSVFGIGNYITKDGINFGQLAIISAVIGFAGAFISLGISRMVAKWMMGVQVLDPKANLSEPERWLVSEVHSMSRDAGLTTMPEVGIYDSPEVNAFATGPTKARSLVAVSTGLLDGMNRNAVKGVLGHEVAHVANGDMVTMTLLQGIINTFVIFLARTVAYFISMAVPREEVRWIVNLVSILVFQILFSILGSLVVCAYSRHREFYADAGGAKLAGKENMLSALKALQGKSEYIDNSQAALATMKISGTKGWMQAFSTHPELSKRIEVLESTAI